MVHCELRCGVITGYAVAPALCWRRLALSCNGRWQFSTPYRIDTNQQTICHRWLRRRPLQLCQIWCTSAHGGVLGEWVKYNQTFIYLCPLFRELTYRSDPRRIFAQGCVLLRFVDIARLFVGQIPKHFGAWIWRFQARKFRKSDPSSHTHWQIYAVTRLMSRVFIF